MKILLIPSWYPGNENPLTGSFFREQASLLSQNGYDIRILFARITPLKFINFLFHLLFHFLQGTKLDTNYLLQEPVAYNFPIPISYRISEKLRLGIIFKSYFSAYTALKSSGWVPDVIHAQSTMDGGFIAHALSKKTNIPFVVIEHQVFLLHELTYLKRSLVLNALTQAKKVGVVSEHQKKMVLMHQPFCSPQVIWNYVDDEVFQIRAGVLRRKFTIITITYPAPIKDVDTFLFAMADLKNSCSDFQFVIVGNGSFNNLSKANTDRYETLARELGLIEFGTFIPYLTRHQIAEKLNECDVFVSTSIAETFGVAAREAMLCGLPVVTTSCGGIEDSIDKRTGIAVPLRDSKAISAALLRIKNRELVYDRQHIRNFVISQCGKIVFLKKMNEFYDF